MKRSEAVNLIINTLSEWTGDKHGLDEPAENILKALESIGMQAPARMKPITVDEKGRQYPLVPGDFKNEKGIWCTPGFFGWEDE